MKCETIKEKIDLLIFEEDKELNEEMSSHIEGCNTCQSYLSESIAAKEIIGQLKKEPELTDSEDLSNSILSQIDEVEQITNSTNGGAKIYLLIRRSFAAASILLMIVFGIEQYVIFDKISRMEEHVSSISTDDKRINMNNIINYNLGFQPRLLNGIFTDGLIIPGDLNLKRKITKSRLSSLIFNKMDNQRISQFMNELSTRSLLKYELGE